MISVIVEILPRIISELIVGSMASEQASTTQSAPPSPAQQQTTNLSIFVVVVVDPIQTSTSTSDPSSPSRGRITPRLIPPQGIRPPPPPPPPSVLAADNQPAAPPHHPSVEPDMGAVYILLGCLAVSGLVVLGILAYCTSYCWRKRCFNGRRTMPSIKISTSVEDGYLALKHMGMNGQPKVVVTTADEQTSIVYQQPMNRVGSLPGSESAFNFRRSSVEPTAIRSSTMDNQTSGYQSTSQSINGRYYNKHRRHSSGRKKHSHFEHSALSPTATFNGTVHSLTSFKMGAGVNKVGHSDQYQQTYTPQRVQQQQNGGTRSRSSDTSTSAQLDPLSDEIERRSVLHYDIGYYEKSHAGCIRGTVTFALRFDYIHRVLMVHLIRANHLTDKDHSAMYMDPYVKMYLLPERRYHCKSKIYRKTLDPEFNEMFSFDAPYNSLTSRMLQFTLYNYDRFTRHGLIGNVIMRDLFEKSDLHAWTEYTMAIIGDNEKDDYGDLLLYLSYDSHDAKLSICVGKACNLRPMDITGASDPYVKMTQLQGRRRIKTRRTTMKRANLHPVYNEIVQFDLSESQIGNTSIFIKVMDWDRIGRDDLLGCCILGSESPTAEGREHWRQCFLRQSEKPVGMWHSLLADIPEGYINIAK